MKKLFSVFLSLLITSGVLISDVYVTHAETKEPIQVGDSVYATLDDYGTLTISGDGDMWENNHMATIIQCTDPLIIRKTSLMYKLFSQI